MVPEASREAVPGFLCLTNSRARAGLHRTRDKNRFAAARRPRLHGDGHVARIAGVNIPTNKRVVIALQYIHGIGSREGPGDRRQGRHPGRAPGQPADRRRGAADPRDHRPRLRRRGRPAPRSVDEHQAAHGSRLPIAACATAAACRSAASARTPTPAPARARRSRSPARRNSGNRQSAIRAVEGRSTSTADCSILPTASD